MSKEKGTFVLVKDLFPKEFREKLPVNFYSLRKKSSEKKNSSFAMIATSSFYNSDAVEVGSFYKNISTIL